MRILLAARRYPPDVWSGTETVFRNIYDQARKGNETRLVVGYRQSRHMVPSEAKAVDLRGVSKPRAWLRMAQGVRTQIRQWQPDAVLSNSIEVPAVGTPTACIVHDLNFGDTKAGFGSMPRKAFYAIRARQLGAIITVSQASADVLVKTGIPAESIHVIHNAVDTNIFCPATSQNSTDPLFHFVYPSRIISGKGQHLAIDAFARMPDRYRKQSRLTIVGAAPDGIYLDRLRVQAYGLPIEFATNVPTIEGYYQSADVILFPSMMTEGFGFTAAEGMACGKPVVWFDQPAVREATGGIGLPVPRGDVDAMKSAMIGLLEDKVLRDSVGEAGLRYVQRHLSWERVWHQYEEVLNTIAAKR